jgi:hypothetical protein
MSMISVSERPHGGWRRDLDETIAIDHCFLCGGARLANLNMNSNSVKGFIPSTPWLALQQ